MRPNVPIFNISFRSLLIVFLLIPAHARAADLNTLEQKASYSFGVDFIRRLEDQNIDLDTRALVRGIEDQAKGGKLALQEGEMTQVKAEYMQQLRAELIQQQQRAAEDNLEAGQAFLAENAKKEGVVTTDSGLQYRILKRGSGPSPLLDDTVVTHYRGTLIDGREFDSSYSRGKPATFPVKGVIKGWTEALQMMKVGGKWKLFIPADLAYGAAQRGELIEPNSTLVFELELLEIK